MGIGIKNLGRVLVLCGVATLISAQGTTRAFEAQDYRSDPLDAKSLLAPPHSLVQDPNSYSLAVPLSGESDSHEFVSSYGNAITIPGPGIDLPAPAWAYSPDGFRRH